MYLKIVLILDYLCSITIKLHRTFWDMELGVTWVNYLSLFLNGLYLPIHHISDPKQVSINQKLLKSYKIYSLSTMGLQLGPGGGAYAFYLSTWEAEESLNLRPTGSIVPVLGQPARVIQRHTISENPKQRTKEKRKSPLTKLACS